MTSIVQKLRARQAVAHEMKVAETWVGCDDLNQLLNDLESVTGMSIQMHALLARVIDDIAHHDTTYAVNLQADLQAIVFPGLNH